MNESASRVCLAAGVAACMLAGPVLTEGLQQAVPAVGPFPAEVSIPNTRRVDFKSRVNGHRYSLSVALPFVPAPRKGYGVLYVLDGYALFGSATEIVRSRGNRTDDVVVVGIDYPTDGGFASEVLTRRGPVPAWYANLPPERNAPWFERNYDLTLPASDEALAAEATRGTQPLRARNVGGLDDFLKTLELEVKPRIAAMVPIDASNQALFGHSLGGLAVLHALFMEPRAFRSFIIASPSIWWNGKAVLADEKRFASAIDAGKAAPRVLVTMGAEESTPPAIPPNVSIAPEAIAEVVRRARMVENARELVGRLQALQGPSGYVVEDYVLFDRTPHSYAAWPALVRGIPFAFSATR